MDAKINRFSRTAASAVAFITVLSLVACASEPPPRHARVPERVQEPPAPPPDTTVYAYPTQNQSAERQERDRYECHLWSVKQSNFDPSGPNIPPRQRIRVVTDGPPPGAGTAAGAVTGAVVGAAVAGRHDAGGGAIVGAVIGGALGAGADASRAAETRRVEDKVQAREDARYARDEKRASDYRRAIGACLEGRGYRVR